jgi:hypothetical protein
MLKYANELAKDKSAQLSDEEIKVIADAVKKVVATRKLAIRKVEDVIE